MGSKDDDEAIRVATTDDTHLGGEDFDNRVMEYLIKQYKKTGTDVSKNLRSRGEKQTFSSHLSGSKVLRTATTFLKP